MIVAAIELGLLGPLKGKKGTFYSPDFKNDIWRNARGFPR
jgi:hypothetical protein